MTNPFDSVSVELSKNRKRQAVNTACVLRAIDELTGHFKAASDALEAAVQTEAGAAPSRAGGCANGGGEAAPEVAATLQELKRRCEEARAFEAVAAEHKNYHACVSRLGKAVDKHLPVDIERVRRSTVTFDEGRLNELIARHLYRRGAFKAARRLSSHPTLRDLPEEAHRPLVEMHEVVQAVRQRDLEPAKRWVEARRLELAEIGSTLDLQLARLQFLSILQRSGPDQRRQAVSFAQSRFPALVSTHMAEIQQLMGCLLWVGRLEQSPYRHLLAEDLWDVCCRAVVADGCRLAGLPRESGLAVVFRAGVMAMPTLIKMAGVVQNSSRDWDTLEELPVEIPLERSMLFHSIFSCPVSREQSTPDNPPVLLKCGHVVCRSSIGRIAKHGPGAKFKCPTCPKEQTEADLRVLHL